MQNEDIIHKDSMIYYLERWCITEEKETVKE